MFQAAFYLTQYLECSDKLYQYLLFIDSTDSKAKRLIMDNLEPDLMKKENLTSAQNLEHCKDDLQESSFSKI